MKSLVVVLSSFLFLPSTVLIFAQSFSLRKHHAVPAWPWFPASQWDTVTVAQFSLSSGGSIMRLSLLQLLIRLHNGVNKKWSALSEIIGITHFVKHFHSKLLPILMKTWNYEMKCFASGKRSRYRQKNDFNIAAPVDCPNFMGPNGLFYYSQMSHMVCDAQKKTIHHFTSSFFMCVRM